MFAPVANFLPRRSESGGLFDRLVVREARSEASASRRLFPTEPKVVHRGDPLIEVGPGNHSVKSPPLGNLICWPLQVLHFPMRSYAQFENKIVKGGAAYARNRELPDKVGRTWRRLYEVWQRGELPQHYAESVVSDATGQDLVTDTRLRDYLRELRLGARTD